MNPLLLIAAFTALAAADFANVAVTGSGQLAQHIVSSTSWNVFWLAAKFSLMSMFMLFGIATVFFAFGQRKPTPIQKRAGKLTLITLLVYLAIFSAWVYLFTGYLTNWTLAEAAYAKAEASNDALLFTMGLLLLPGLCYCLPRRSLKFVVSLVAISAVVLLFSGSRTRILYVAIPFMFYLVRVRGIKVPRALFGVASLVTGILAILAINYRAEVTENTGRLSVVSLANPGGALNINDISFVESNIALSRIDRRRLARYPGEDLAGFVFAAIPRAALPIKPLNASAQFTSVYDILGWRKFSRGLTIGGVNELEYFYPYPIGLVVMFLLGAAWAAAFRWAATSKSIHGFVWTAGLYAILYAFLKADLQASGQLVSVFLIYSALVKAIQALPAARSVASSSAPARVVRNVRIPQLADGRPASARARASSARQVMIRSPGRQH